MNVWISLIGLACFIAYLTHADLRKRRKAKKTAPEILTQALLLALIDGSPKKAEIVASVDELIRTSTIERWGNSAELREAFAPIRDSLMPASEADEIPLQTRMLAAMTEQQAKLDLLLLAVRLLLKTHPNAGDIGVLLRAATTHMNAASARDLPDTHGIYERALNGALESLVGE